MVSIDTIKKKSYVHLTATIKHKTSKLINGTSAIYIILAKASVKRTYNVDLWT